MAPHLKDDGSVEEMDFVNVTPSSLQVQWKSEYPFYDNELQEIYVNGNVKAPICTEEQRKPVDVVVVLDRSGSMSGQKLDLSVKTIKFLIQELSPSDRLSIISYDTMVRTDISLTKMNQKGKAAVELVLPRIRAGSMTNLSGGLLQGLQEIQQDKRDDGETPNAVKSVLLLTDGLANHGITSTPELVQLASAMLHNDVSLFTFGYGSDHNEELLRGLSDAGRGVYYFVENVDGVSLAFADCLGGLLSVVAQNIKLELTAAQGCEIVSIKTKKEVKETEKNHRCEILVGDMYGEEERDFLLIIKIRGMKQGEKASFAPLACRISYANVIESSFVNQDSSLFIERFNALSVERVPDSHVLCQKNRVLAAEAMEEATTVANMGNFSEARNSLCKARELIGATLVTLLPDDKAQTEVLMSELREAQGSVMSHSVYYGGGGGKRLAAQTQMHYHQRNNEISTAAMELSSAPMSAQMEGSAGEWASGHTRTRTYRSSGRMMMMKKAFLHNKSP